MSDWLFRQKKKLWWKEFQESWIYLLMAWIIIMMLMVFLPVTYGRDVLPWGYSFHYGAVAILLFVALCLGVTAYAVEEEYETLAPLLAKPISENDILATKLGVRMGLIFLSMLLLGALELLTGMWPVEYGTIDPEIYERWVAGLTIVAMGLSLGFYFGKTFGRQTQALVASSMIILVGFVFLAISPLSYVFDTETAYRYIWIRGILLPGLVMAGAITAVILGPAGEGGFFTRRKALVTAVALGVYALILWSLVSIPYLDLWRRPDHYQKYLAVALGTPEAGLAALQDEHRQGLPRDFPEEPERIGLELIKSTSVRLTRPESTSYPSYWDDDWLLVRGNSMLGIRMPDTQPEEYRPRIRTVLTFSGLERYTATKRKAGWIGECLELALDPSATLVQKLLALHLAGVADHPEHTGSIAIFLDDPSVQVRLMAAIMLAAREELRGEEALKTIVARPENLGYLYHISPLRGGGWRLDFGPEYEDLMRSWALSQNQTIAHKTMRSVAQDWYSKHGSAVDSDLIRQSLWLDQSERTRATGAPAEISLLSFLRDWEAPGYEDELYRMVMADLEEAEALLSEVEKIPSRIWENRRLQDRLASEINLIYRYRSARRTLARHLTELFNTGDERVIDLWRRAHRADVIDDYRRYDSSYGNQMISLLPGFGEEGFEILQTIVYDRNFSPAARFQAAMILAHRGYQEYHDEGIRIYQTYQGGRYYGYYSDYNMSTFYVLLREGHLRYAEYIIDEAWKSFQGRGGMNWNYKIVQGIQEATGQRFGWNIKKWKKWWEREGQFIAAAGN